MPDYYVITALPDSREETPNPGGTADPVAAAASLSSSALAVRPGGGRAAEIFSDEVVVDFPSLEGAIARIRAGFEIDEIERQVG